MESGMRARGRGLRVLFVDDDEDTRLAYEAIADALQIDVELARCGSEALAKARIVRPDLIMLDFALPDIDGLEVLHHLKGDSATSSIPVILLTATSGAIDESPLALAQVADILLKPCSLEALDHAIERAVSPRRAGVRDARAE